MNKDLVMYIFSQYGHFRTAIEQRALQHLIGKEKPPVISSEPERQARLDRAIAGFISDDPAVLQMTDDGFEAFRERTAERILADNKAAIVLNTCPKCGAICRTPTARQCRICRHDWHDLPATS